MSQLNKNVIAIRDDLPEQVLQFGEGNFLRAFIDWMFHRMNESGVFNGRVVVVQPLETGLIDLLNYQNGLYTLYLRGIDNGQTINQKEVITSVSRGINPYSKWEDYLETAHNFGMRFVVSNTTEAGIEYIQTAKPDQTAPALFPAKLTAWLAERFAVFGGSKESGVILMPCELINHNGDQLKECVLKHAADWALGGGFMKWINSDCVFLNTLVDRIVPGYPRDEAAEMTAGLGYEDKLICTGEIFHLLVVEGPERLKEELPFHKAGLNVIWCDDMQLYRTRKVGILNGAHTATALAAFLGGVDTVREMMEDPDFGVFVRKTVFSEIVPSLRMDEGEKRIFAESVIERFLNPYIRHELISISLNSVSKWKVRVLPSVKNYIADHGEAPLLLSFSLAALIAFYKGDLRAGYQVCDDEEIIAFFSATWAQKDPAQIVQTVLRNENLWGENITKLPGMETSVLRGLELILNKGSRVAVTALLDSK